MTIWKFPLVVTDEQTIKAPILRVLTVQTQQEIPCLWAVVNPEGEPVDLRVWMVGTGHEGRAGVLRSATYSGTFQLGAGVLVFHTFIVFMAKGQVTLGV